MSEHLTRLERRLFGQINLNFISVHKDLQKFSYTPEIVSLDLSFEQVNFETLNSRDGLDIIRKYLKQLIFEVANNDENHPLVSEAYERIDADKFEDIDKIDFVSATRSSQAQQLIEKGIRHRELFKTLKLVHNVFKPTHTIFTKKLDEFVDKEIEMPSYRLIKDNSFIKAMLEPVAKNAKTTYLIFLAGFNSHCERATDALNSKSLEPINPKTVADWRTTLENLKALVETTMIVESAQEILKVLHAKQLVR